MVKTLKRIDLSCNDLSDEYGPIITKFIQSQTELRDSMKWQSTLRGRKVDKSINELGLKELILHHNYLGPHFMNALSNKIKNDLYIKQIDLRHNQFNR